MTATIPQPHLLVTATVQPQIQTVQLTDPTTRLNQYIDALSKIPDGLFGTITIVENSGNNFSEAVKKLFKKTDIEFICFTESRPNITIAQLEAGIYSAFLQNSSKIYNQRVLVKLTGRYRIDSIEQYLTRYSNLAISFRPTPFAKSAALLTSFYKLSIEQFIAFEAYLQVADFHEIPLEVLFAEYVQKQRPTACRVKYPEIKGWSGTFATKYEDNIKERMRVRMSRFVPFALTWD